MTEGWVIMNANMDQYRAWQNGGTVWVKDLADATFYARRVDAEAVHLDDDAAWRVVRKPLPDGGEAVHTRPLSAALPLLLEGKREEIARVIDPDGYWERLDSCNHALATVQMNDDQRHALTKVRDDELRCTAESLAKADRIIAMLGGGDVG